MKNKKKILTLIVLIVAIFLLLIGYYSFNSHRQCKSFVSKYRFDFKQTLQIGSTVNASTVASSLKPFLNNKDKVIIFGSRFCGNCLKLDPAIPFLVNKFDKLQWIYVEKSGQKPISILENTAKTHKNFSVITDKDESKALANLFESYYTPNIFLLHNSQIVYEKLGFMASDFNSLVNVLMLFSEGKYSEVKSLSQKTLVENHKFPKIVCPTYSNRKVHIPEDFIGKPTVILIMHGTCMRCKQIAANIPQSFKKNNSINKLIVFSAFSKELNEKSLEYAKRFGMKELYYELKNPPTDLFFGINTVRSLIGKNQSITYINDTTLNFQNSIGFVSAPSMILIDKSGNFIGIFSLPLKDKDIIKFFNCLSDYLKNL